MKRQRGFEFVRDFAAAELTLPSRSTPCSAGYDIAAAAALEIAPGALVLIPTGIKAYMLQDEYLGLHIRSSLAVKFGLRLANGQGIIDSDYYNNPDNEGHILLTMVNDGVEEVTIHQGMRLAQGIFYKYLLADGDGHSDKELRAGGIGSTGL